MIEDRESTAALIIPALDEEAMIGRTLASVPHGLFKIIIVADNGSRDRTAEAARAAGAVVASEPRRGYGAACLRAMRELPDSIEAVVFMQADSSEDPREAARLLAPLYEGRADLVLGSRTLGRVDRGALLRRQRFGARFITALIRLLFGYRYTDLGPFRAIRADALRKLGMRDRGYGWTVEMQVLALQHGLRVLEAPISYHVRAGGENKVSGNLRASLMAGFKMTYVVLRLRLLGP